MHCREMQQGCTSLVKSNWVKLVLGAVFVLVNLTLYMQSKHLILEIILPHFATNRTFASVLINDTNGNSKDGSNLLSQHITLAKSSDTAILDRPFLRQRIRYPHDFNYMVKPNVTCSKEDVTLLICVPITYSNYEGRSVIRRTWGSYAYNTSNKARLVFFIGKIPPELEKSAAFTQRNISEESSIYRDILQEDYIDSYKNLSLKSVSILKWVSLFCPTSRFVLKVDDDMYVNIPFLVNILHEYSLDKTRPEAYIIGSLQVNANPNRDSNSKWYTPVSQFPGHAYPNYVSGTAYAMTGVAVSLLYQASLRVSRFWLEDIYITGLCAQAASIQVYDSGYFTYGKREVSGCSFKSSISGHRYTHQEILQIHKELYDPNLKC